MENYCDVCDEYIKPQSKSKHFKPDIHKELDECKHSLLSLKEIDVEDVDEAFYLYICEHNKKCYYHHLNCQFILAFLKYQHCPYMTFKLSDNKTMIAWSDFSKKIFNDFKDEGYTLNNIGGLHIITIANKLDMSYGF